MKNPTHLVGAVAALLLVTFAGNSDAQLAASGTPGDRAVYTLGAGATLGTGLGTSAILQFTAAGPVADTADSFNATGAGVVELTAGHHLVLYGTRYQTAANARAAIDATVKINGSTVPYGASAGYLRNSTANNIFIRGGTILDIATGGDTLEIEVARTDNHSQTINELDADLQLVKLDDGLDYLRLSQSADVANFLAPAANGPSVVSYDTQDEIAGASFAHAPGTGQITLADAGRYLVFANSGFRASTGTQRQAITQQLTLNGSLVDDSSTQVYLRHSGSGDGAGGLIDLGAASLGMVLETTTADAVLQVEAHRDNDGTTAAIAIEAARTSITILKLPGYGEYISLSGPTQEVNFVQADPETALDLSDSAAVSNNSFSYDPASSVSDVRINKLGDYLFLASHYTGDYDTPGGDSRTSVRQGFVTTPSGGSAANVSYGHGGSYNRDDVAGADRARDSGAWAGAVLPLGSGDIVVTSGARYGDADSSQATVGLQALNIASISAAPLDPVVATNTGLAVLVGTAGTVITAAHLETVDDNNTPDELTYTLLDDPTGGTLRLDGVALAGSGNFTQEDIDNGLLTFDAGATPGTGFGFEFEVLDDVGANEAIGTFEIAVGVATMLVADSGATDEDTAVTTVNGGDTSVFDNDTGTALAVVSHDATSALGAVVTVSGDGTLSYDPNPSLTIQALDDGEVGNDSFDLTITDFTGANTPATVTITVTGLNDAPVVVGEALQTGNHSVASANLLANDSDVDTTDLLSLSSFEGGALGVFTTPAGAVVTVALDGSFSYDPCPSADLTQLGPGASETEMFTYEVSDGTTISTGSVTVTTLGEYGAGSDIESVDANGVGSTINVEIFSNDTIGGAAGTPTAGAVLDLNAADGGNTDADWVNNGAGGGALVMEGAGTESILIATAGAPIGISAAYDLSGTGSGDQILAPDDGGNLYGSNTSTLDLTVEMVFRPDDLVGDEPLWGAGGNGTGSSLVLLGDQLIFTVGQNAIAAQARGTLPSADWVHVIATVNLATDTVELFINGVLADSFVAVDFGTGLAGNLTDWSGTDDEGIGRSAGTTGGDINVAPFLGSFGTVDIPDFNDAADRFDGELAIVRAYSSVLDAAARTANFEAVFGAITTTGFGVTSLADVAGMANPAASQVIDLPSGARVTVEADGSLTYDPNGAFDDVGLGVTALDSFTYTLANAGGLNATATVKITINGTNEAPQITIAADQTNVSEGGTAGFTISASSAVVGNTDVTLNYSGVASSGSDFTGGSTMVTIPNGTDTVDLDLATIADSLFEGAEDIIVTITDVPAGNVIGSTSVASTLIDDGDDPPVYSIAADSASVAEGNDAGFTISSTTAAAVAVDVTLSPSGAASSLDGFLIPRTVTIPASAHSLEVSATIFDDGHADDGETLTYTIDDVSVGGIGTASASTTLTDGSASGLFLADFEGVTISPSTGTNALAAANEGTITGSIEGVPSTTTTGEVPGVVLESGTDVKGDGFDHALRIDRPVSTADGMVDAVLAEAMDLSANSGFVSFDISSRRTAGNDQKNSAILGLDSLGEVSFKLIVSANNSGAVDELLVHEDAAGTLTPLGNTNDLANSGGNDEDDMTRVTLLLSPGGYQVAIDVEPIDGIPETVTGVLPYAGPATQITRVQFAIAGSTNDGFNGGLLLDDICAAGVIGNVPPTLAFAGASLADGGATALSTMFTGGTRSFRNIGGTLLSVADVDDKGGIETVRLQSVAGLGTITVTLLGGATVSAGANGSSDVTVSGTLTALNASLGSFPGVNYTAGGVAGNETLRITADDGGNTGAPGAASVSHDFTFLVTSNPTVTIDQDAGQGDPTVETSVEFTAVFSEAVDNFDGSDIDFAGSTSPGALSATVSGGPVSWTISVTGASDCEDVVVSLPVGAATRAGTADPSEASTSTDNSVTHFANLPPSATNLGQDLDLGTVNTPLDDIVVTDGNGSRIGNRGATAATFNWLNGEAGPVPGDPPDHTLGFSLDIELTPDAADLAVGTTVTVYETGGTSNGHGIYLIDGVPYFICKMNGGAGTVPSGLLDTDWNTGDVISIPLAPAALLPDSPTTIALIFTLDSVTYSTNGSLVPPVPLANRGTRNNWSGDDTLSIGAIAGGGAGGLSNVPGPYDAATDVQPIGIVASMNFWRATDADFSIKALGEEIITATMTILQPGAGALTTSGSATFAADVWTITDTISAVNLALAAVEFAPAAGAPDFVEIQVIIDDGDEDGSPPPEGEINLIRRDSVIEQWRIDNGYSADGSGPGEGDTDISAPNGLTNMENFAHGFDAQGSADTGNLSIDVAGGTITAVGRPNVVQDPADGLLYFQFTRRADYVAAGLTFDHQFSGDLALWEANAAPVPAVVASGTGDDGVAIEALRIELPAALPSGAQAYFGRLLITITP